MSKESKLTYSETLEARAQRGEMTHQKEAALKILKDKEQKEKIALTEKKASQNKANKGGNK
ncbi:hypothetical protein [Enterococcus alishanensis]